jgi:hypothetical protein
MEGVTGVEEVIKSSRFIPKGVGIIATQKEQHQSDQYTRLSTSRCETTPILCTCPSPILQSGHTSQHTHGTESEASKGGLSSGTSRSLGAGGSRGSPGGRARRCSAACGTGSRLVGIASVGESLDGDTGAVLAVRAVLGRGQLSRGECDVGAL